MSHAAGCMGVMPTTPQIKPQEHTSGSSIKALTSHQEETSESLPSNDLGRAYGSIQSRPLGLDLTKEPSLEEKEPSPLNLYGSGLVKGSKEINLEEEEPNPLILCGSGLAEEELGLSLPTQAYSSAQIQA